MTTIFFLHALGGSARAWDRVIAGLGGHDCVAINLPGFGDAADEPGYAVGEMVATVSARIRARRADRWVIVGHSMGGKIATLVAAAAQREGDLPGLAGVALFAASPLMPEPMAEDRRAEMIGWAQDHAIAARDARTFVDANIAAPLPGDLDALAIMDVQRSDRQAWLAWLERGSREDWSDQVTQIAVPALIVAGADDGDLGEAAQRGLNLPLYPGARFATIDHAAHLMPLEQPEQVAALIRDLVEAAAPLTIPPAYARLLASDRVSARTRRTLAARAMPDRADHGAQALSGAQLATLRVLLSRILPHGDPSIDLAARIDRQLAAGEGDGWRFADLPADAEAYRAGLDTLTAMDFAGLTPAAQDALLDRIAQGDAPDHGVLSGTALEHWFEDVRSDAVRLWLSHPAAMARIGYDGFANGGDGLRFQGYQRTGADDPEPWQLSPAGASR